MTFFKSSLNLALLSLLTCAGLAAPALATADSDNSIRNAQFEGTVVGEASPPGESVRSIAAD
jgi:hypothetical protein